MAATYKLVVDWNADGDYTDSNDDITGDTLSVNWFRGRDYASQLTGNSIAGLLEAVLVNTDGKYSPSNTGSALSGNLVPGRLIQMQMGSGDFPYTFPFIFADQPSWTGRIESITPSPSASDVKTCKIKAFGALAYINQFKVQLETQTDRRTDQAVGDILDDVGWPSADRDLDSGISTIDRFWISDKGTIESLQLVEQAEAGFIKETGTGEIGFENRYHRLTTPSSTTSQITFTDATDATYPYMALDQDDPLSTIINHFEASVRTYTTGTLAALWTHPETGASSPTLAPSEAKTFEAVYPNPDAGNNAVEVNAWTTPAATTDYLANTASDGSGTNKTSDITVSQTKLATRMIMTFSNGSTDPVFMTKIQARGTPVTTSNPVLVRAIDSDSKTKYGERKFIAGTRFISTTTLAQAWCDYHLVIYESPVDVLTLVFSAGTTNGFFAASTMDLSNRVTIVGTSSAAVGINTDFFIENISQRLAQGSTDHVVTIQLSPATGGYSQFWVLGTSVLGTSTVPAF
jgi:hypothetical protein